jgi:transcriptional regulator with XRE-family HTH domain
MDADHGGGINMQLEIGGPLRRARTAQGLSLRSVASAVGVSPSLLSQVETNKVQPSVGTLYAIVTHLGLSIDELLAAGSPPPSDPKRPRLRQYSPVQRAGEAPTLVMENGVTWERLAIRGQDDPVDPLLTTYDPGGSSAVDNALMTHEGYEYGVILSGELTLQLEFESYILRAGDSVCFDSRRPHLYTNHTDQVTKGIWFVVGTPGGHRTEGDPHSSGEIRNAVDVIESFSRG